MYNLFLDDVREVSDVTWVKLPLVPWIIVRNYNEFVDIVTKKGLPRYVTFDHDLSIEHYTEADFQKFLRKDYTNLSEKTGYDCAKWLVNYCLDNKLAFPKYFVHSMNPIGKENTINYIEKAKMYNDILRD